MIVIYLTLICIYGHFVHCAPDTLPIEKIITATEQTSYVLNNTKKLFMNRTRRILNGNEVGDTRPYVVYLRPGPNTTTPDEHWVCGGAIIHERFILTSAACIEDVKHFYVVSGTSKWVASQNTNACIKNGAKRAIWKCEPKSYVFDGREFDNIRWMLSDIAVVKTEDDFNFRRRVKGCDFIPQKVAFNNASLDYEKPGTKASTTGWGSTERWSDLAVLRSASNSLNLLETEVILISARNCKKRWEDRYHHIIDKSMVCGKDSADSDTMNSICSEKEVNCHELVYSVEQDESLRKQNSPDVVDIKVPNDADDGPMLHKTRRAKAITGGFCENDHGGPLVVGYGKTSIVIGVISATRTNAITKKCYGPFLFTSVFKHRNLISCAINREIMDDKCKTYLRTEASETIFRWPSEDNAKKISWDPQSIKEDRDDRNPWNRQLRDGKSGRMYSNEDDDRH